MSTRERMHTTTQKDIDNCYLIINLLNKQLDKENEIAIVTMKQTLQSYLLNIIRKRQKKFYHEEYNFKKDDLELYEGEEELLFLKVQPIVKQCDLEKGHFSYNMPQIQKSLLQCFSNTKLNEIPNISLYDGFIEGLNKDSFMFYYD